jgi:hypothetical protein
MDMTGAEGETTSVPSGWTSLNYQRIVKIGLVLPFEPVFLETDQIHRRISLFQVNAGLATRKY